MIWIIIILSVIVLALLLYIIWCRNEFKQVSRKIQHIRSEDTNMLVTTNMKNMASEEIVSEINELQQHCRKLIKEYERKDLEIKETMTSLAHDIRTPLTSLDGYFQLLLESGDEEEKQHYARIIRRRIDSLKNLLEELFTYTKLQDINYNVDLSRIEVGKLCFDSVVSFYDDFKAAGINAEINLQEEPVYISGNATAFTRVVQNIVKNSLIHSKSKVKLILLKQDGYLKFICRNDVENVDEIDVNKVFDRFYKVNQNRGNGSTGLGLAIAKMLTEKMGGMIKADILLEQNEFQIAVYFPLK